MEKLFVVIVFACFIVKTSAAADRSTRTVAPEDAALPASQTAPPTHSPAAMRKGGTGHAMVRVTTDSFGNVTRAVIVEKCGSVPDRDIISCAERWKGPPISSRTIPVFYRSDGQKPSLRSNNAALTWAGWQTMRPPYPRSAISARAQGSGVVRVTTNRFGRVDEVEIVKRIHPLLDAHTAAFARANWTGPPNGRATFPIIYLLK